MLWLDIWKRALCAQYSFMFSEEMYNSNLATSNLYVVYVF
jgi:hypothetical protein